MVALLMLGGWCVYAAEDPSSAAWQTPVYVAGCPVEDGTRLTKGSAREDAGTERCSEEGLSHPISSRKPGAGLGEQAHRSER